MKNSGGGLKGMSHCRLCCPAPFFSSFLSLSLFFSSETTTESIPLSYIGHSTLIQTFSISQCLTLSGLTSPFLCINTALSLKGILVNSIFFHLHYTRKTDFERSCYGRNYLVPYSGRSNISSLLL